MSQTDESRSNESQSQSNSDLLNQRRLIMEQADNQLMQILRAPSKKSRSRRSNVPKEQKFSYTALLLKVAESAASKANGTTVPDVEVEVEITTSSE